jgi:protease-4
LTNMKRVLCLVGWLGWLLWGCAPHFHLDFLGKESLQEKVLVPARAKAKILVVDVTGVLKTEQSQGLWQREGDVISRVYQRLSAAAEDKQVKGVILRLDTPGGEVTSSDILYHEILKFKERTGIPVVALMMGMAASGGYYVACACDYMIAHPSTITGSIGVISIFPDFHELLNKVGVRVNIVKSGEMKDAGSPFKEMNRDDRDVFEAIIEEMYRKFLAVIGKNRKEAIAGALLRELADGRVYTAAQALEHKLIDEIGYFEAALDKVKATAGIAEAVVVTYTHYPSRRTNIYAPAALNPNPFNINDFYEKILPSLKTGFYYLWLPQLPQ